MYKREQIREPLILEPEDWSAEEWVVICKLFSFPVNLTERIVVNVSNIESFVRDNTLHPGARYRRCDNTDCGCVELVWATPQEVQLKVSGGDIVTMPTPEFMNTYMLCTCGEREGTKA